MRTAAGSAVQPKSGPHIHVANAAAKENEEKLTISRNKKSLMKLKVNEKS